MKPTIRRAARIFYSYAAADDSLREGLDRHLKLLERQGLIAPWHDRQIQPGYEWKGLIDRNLERADIILLLISDAFMASDYCWDVEMAQALRRHQDATARVIPIRLRPIGNWHLAPFAQLQSLPVDGVPVSSWPDQDSAWASVAEDICEVVVALREQPEWELAPTFSASNPAPCTPDIAAGPPTYLPTNAAHSLRGPLVDREGNPYRPTLDLIRAAEMAMVLGAPLLLTGEPGCGKTQFAWAAAQAIGRPGPLICSLRSDRRARDWFYYYDAERRMADAQSRRTERQDRALWPHFYIELRPLGKALMSARQEVVLIDEIDKAPKDLFDDLWWQLDQGSFEITEIGEETPPFPTEFQRMMKSPPGAPRPLIVITCNGERQLPLRFMRRCIIHNILFPAWHEGEVGKSDYTLLDILRDHFNQDLTATPSPQRDVFYRAVLTVFMRLRTGYELTKRPSTAELLDWTKALLHHGEKAMAEVQRLAQQPEKIQFVGLPGIECLLRLPQDLQKVVAWPSTGAQPGFRAHPTKA